MSGKACAACGTTNEDDARFCEGCGASLARTCGSCGAEASATARFCRACGTPLGTSEGTPVRKTVSVMFADLAGSTRFEEQVDAETAREVIAGYHQLLRSTADRHRAGVTKYIGDGFMAVWGAPEMGSDDAGHAVDAAVELQERFVEFAAHVAEAHGVDLALRVAVNTGEVVVGAGDADLIGDALNVGARLEAECERGRVVVGEETWRATRGRNRYESLGQIHVKGRSAPVAVYRWAGRESDAFEAAVFVGRTDELRRLQTALDDAVAARACRLVTVIGDPGVGKSRLATEFVEAQRGVCILQARCDADQTVALAPIVEVLRTRNLDTDISVGFPERNRVLDDLTGLTEGVPGSVEETFWALRQFVEAMASDEPLLLILDDLHWADTLLLDFVEHLVEWARRVPVLVVALARPELREVRPDLVTVSRWVSQAVHLGGLDPGATAELAAGVLGTARLPDELVNRLPSSTGGNPLFVRELVGMLVHDGVLVREPAGWRLTIDVDAITIPPTIQALLASRLERLDVSDRRVLEIASVVGYDFSLAALCALEQRGAAAIKSSLDRLRRLEFAQPSGTYIGDEPVWRFHHVLIRDVAYRRLLKSDRAKLHERLAEWVEGGGPSVAFDTDEMVARHLEAAYNYRVELGTHDERTSELALRSARSYLASARRALDRDELVSAGTQAARGACLAAADEALHAELLMVGCEAFLSCGDVASGAPLVDDLDRIAREALAPWAICYRCQLVVYTDPARLPEVDDRLQAAIDEFARRDDAAGLAKAHRVRASARARLGRIGDCEVDLFEALIAARRGGDHRQITAALAAAPAAALWGPSPVPKAGGRCLDVVRMQRMTTAAPSLEATSLRCLAVLELLRGRPDKARSMLADARQVVADLGLRHGLMETELFAGIIESMVGDPVAAEPHFRTALQGLDALGVGADAGQAAALLARSVLAQGRVDEADRYATQSEQLAGHNLKTAIAWRAVRAEILAAQGCHRDAVAMAREAVAVAADTDLVLDHADACLALGRVLAASGDERGAAEAQRTAESLYAAKDAVIATGHTMEPVAPAPATPGSTPSRLLIRNRASEISDTAYCAMQERGADAIDAVYSASSVYEDRRRLKGEPVVGLAALRAAAKRKHAQYPHCHWRTLAVRGETLLMLRARWWDDAGNETTTLDVVEVALDGSIRYQGRFDEDDFWGAYGELERRYYAGEGAAFAESGHAASAWVQAIGQRDVEAARKVSAPEFRWHAPPGALKADERTVDHMFQWMGERGRQVATQLHWVPVLNWVSPTCAVGLGEIRAIGVDGEEYGWNFIYAGECRDGLLASVREFRVEDEDAAFAYAESVGAQRRSRLAVRNRGTEAAASIYTAMNARDVDAAVECYADGYTYDDRRRLCGNPVENRQQLRAAAERALTQYNDFRNQPLAVRGESLQLSSATWSDRSGNETKQLHVFEVNDDGLIIYEGRFDEDDFEGAYCELDRRYYAGEGALYAESGATCTEIVMANNRGDFEKLFGEFVSPDFRFDSRSHSPFPDRSAAELRATTENLSAMVGSVRIWYPVLCWLSPNWFVATQEREAVGSDEERFEWTRIYVGEIRHGLCTYLCDFDAEDEEDAFAYAEERMRATSSRLPASNGASRAADALVNTMNAHDLDASIDWCCEKYVFDDRRQLSGDPIEVPAGLRTALERILNQFNDFEGRTLAVRGERLSLYWSRWSDEAGNRSDYLHVFEVGDDGRIAYQASFDDDDFIGAYRELERRYYADEGAAYAQSGATTAESIVAINQGDFERLFGELSSPDLRVENRSLVAFPDRSASDLRESFGHLDEMTASMRTWLSAVCWVSPAWSVSRLEREALGPDGERYDWTRLLVTEVRNGKLASMCEFEHGDEEGAFAYAEQRAS